MANKNLVTFLDSAQRTIIAEKVETDNDQKTLTVKNPVVVNIVPQHDPATGQPTGSMALQLLPVYFREFMGDKSAPAIFTYPNDLVTLIDFEGGFDFRLYGQYDNIFNPPSMQSVPQSMGGQSQPAQEAPVLKLFDE